MYTLFYWCYSDRRKSLGNSFDFVLLLAVVLPSGGIFKYFLLNLYLLFLKLSQAQVFRCYARIR